MTSGTNQPDDLVGEPLDRRAAPLRLGHHLDDTGEQGVAADLLGFHDKPPDRLIVPPMTLSPAPW